MRPGDTLRGMAHFEDSTGALADADALPTGVLRRNGVTLAGAAVTVTKVGTGAYTWSVLLDPDDGWVPGDTAVVEISGAVDGISMAQSLSAVIGGVRQTGDAYARIGEGGAGLTAVAQASAYTAERAEKLDYLDATVSSRMAGSAYTPPDNAGIAAVKAQTDKLQFSDSNDVKATLDGEAVTAAVVNDKTGYSLATDQSGVTIGTVNSLGATAQGQVNTEVDAALNAPIDDAPADGSINERIKALDDAYTAERAEKLDYLGPQPGARTVTRVVKDSVTGDVLAGALVRYTLGVKTYVDTSDSHGVVTFNLDDGEWSVAATLSSYSYAGGTHNVSADTISDLLMDPIIIAPIADPDQCVCYLRTCDGQGAAQGNIPITFKMIVAPTGSGVALDSVEFTATSNPVTGVLEIPLVRRATYYMKRETGRWQSITIPDADTYELPSLIG